MLASERVNSGERRNSGTSILGSSYFGSAAAAASATRLKSPNCLKIGSTTLRRYGVQAGDLPARDDNPLGQLVVALATVGEVVGLLPVRSIFVVVVLGFIAHNADDGGCRPGSTTIHVRQYPTGAQP